MALFCRLVAHWTAPGDNYDQGTVRKYHFVYSPSPFAFRTTSGGGGAKGIETFHEAETLHEKAGSPMTYSFTFDKFDRPYHLAIYAVDEAGNAAEFSNVVRVFLPTPEDPQTTTESSGITNTYNITIGPKDLDPFSSGFSRLSQVNSWDT